MASPRYRIRDMTADDVPAVRRIESAAYEDAWPSRIFETELQNAFAHYRALVELPDREPPTGRFESIARRLSRAPRDRVIGFMGVWYMIDQLHLVTIAIDPREQRRGFGQALMLECCALAGTAELNEIVLEVRVSNEPAQRLYESFGFRRAGTLKAYYKDNDEDAYVMLTGPLDAPALRERIEARRAAHLARFGGAFEV
ncbi:MAG: ribosomal-protein-alanine N-acetyltransferase [Chloroflexi bacterium]|nr:ribosomal protein S18-alanine N-acetyltransferase [Chloroflexota bacterium]MQC19303.1 ribosomal-protein-alanine N-acetyltransferase [Chloroflexota bacterium]